MEALKGISGMNSPIELLEIFGEFWEVSAAVCPVLEVTLGM